MSKPGPGRTPTSLLQLRGSWLPASHKNEPKTSKKRPRQLSGMSKSASDRWDRLMPHLMEMGILSAVDGEALRRYCQTLAHWKRYQAMLVKQAVDLGAPKYARGLRLYRNLSTLLHRMDGEFGLSPSARASLEVSDEVQESELEKTYSVADPSEPL